MNTKKTGINEMPNSAIDQLQQTAARVAGLAFLFAIVIVVIANYGINFPCYRTSPLVW